MSAAWESLEPYRNPDVSESERNRFLAVWEEHRRIYGYTLLAELVYALRRALKNDPDLMGLDYDALIVDEYQDLNACDLDVLEQLAQRGDLLSSLPETMTSPFTHFAEPRPKGSGDS